MQLMWREPQSKLERVPRDQGVGDRFGDARGQYALVHIHIGLLGVIGLDEGE
jgi:hypothetical protein